MCEQEQVQATDRQGFGSIAFSKFPPVLSPRRVLVMSSTSHVADAVAAADFFAAAGFEWAAAWPALAYTGSHVDLGTFLIIGRGDRGCGRLRRGRSGGVLLSTPLEVTDDVHTGDEREIIARALLPTPSRKAFLPGTPTSPFRRRFMLLLLVSILA